VIPPPQAESSVFTGLLFHPDRGESHEFTSERPRFTVKSEAAQVVQITCERSRGGYKYNCPAPQLDVYFRVKGTVVGSLDVTIGFNGVPLRRPLKLWYCTASMREATWPNRSIQNTINGNQENVWHGPVVAMKFNGTRRRSFASAGFHDLVNLSHFFRYRQRDPYALHTL
jgi:hypothetical protein